LDGFDHFTRQFFEIAIFWLKTRIGGNAM